MAIGFNVYRNRKGNKDDSARPNAHGLGGGQRVPANHHRPPAYEDDSKDEDEGYGGYQREARCNRELRIIAYKLIFLVSMGILILSPSLIGSMKLKNSLR